MAPRSKIHDSGIRNKVLDLLAEGNFLEVAAASAGITPRTLRTWRIKGEEAQAKRDACDDLNETESLYARFLDEVGTHRALGEEKLVRRITTAARNDWKAAAWILERAFPQRWGKREVPPEPIDYDKIADAVEHALLSG